MKTFLELNEMCATVNTTLESASALTGEQLKNVLDLFTEVKYTCEANEGLVYHSPSEAFDVRFLRDMCIAALNYAGNVKLLKARFYSVWGQINAIVY